MDKNKHEDATTVTVNLACDKVVAAAVEYNESFSESDKSVYQERQQLLLILIAQAKII